MLSTDPPGLITTAFYGYDPGAGYETSDTLKKGLGYWVKASADGVVIFNTSYSAECGVKRVEYGGISYGTVRIGSQCWLDQNLNVGDMVMGTNQTDNVTTEKYCFNNDPLNCALYGGFYQWHEAMQYSTTEGTQGICPPGYHIPTLAEFTTLKSTVGENGNALKRGWVGTGSGVGTNTSGFSALLAGSRNYVDGGFYGLGDIAYFWSSTESDSKGLSAYNLGLNTSNSGVYLPDYNKYYGFSVRCLED